MKRILFLLTVIFLPLVLESEAQAADWALQTHNKQQYVSLSNVKEFYGFDKLDVRKNAVVLENDKVKLELVVNGHECLMNNVKFILANPILSNKGKLLLSVIDLNKIVDPVLRPSYIAGGSKFDTVILDPGHGGKDPGAVNGFGTEAGYNLAVALSVRDMLKKLGINVILTRQDNKFVSLADRVKFANRHKNAIFISIHFNAGGAGNAHGLETFTLSPSGVAHHGRKVRSSDFRVLNGNFQDSQNIALATAIHGRARLNLNVFDRGIKRARYSVLTGIKHPAILIEGGFMSHKREAKEIHTARYKEEFAVGIVEGILVYKVAFSANSRK